MMMLFCLYLLIILCSGCLGMLIFLVGFILGLCIVFLRRSLLMCIVFLLSGLRGLVWIRKRVCVLFEDCVLWV